jgi:replicative DNA helicase
MQTQTDNFSKFGKTFQEKLCQLILEDRPFCDQITEVLDINFLEVKYLQVFIQEILDYRIKYKVHPTYEILATIFRSGISQHDDAVQKQVRDFYARVVSTKVEGAQFVKDTAMDFCRKQVLKQAMMKSVGLLKTSSFDEISKVINDALKLGSDNNFGHDWLADFERRFEIKARNPVTTGWERMDALCKGGLGRSELGVVIAPTGAGKSMVLVHLGTQALKEGKTVVHYTLELADTVVGSRYDSCITGIPLNDLMHNKAEIFDRISDVEGSLIVKEYPTKSATTQSIRNHLEKLKKRGIHPDMVIVDYADLLRPVKGQSEKRHELESLYEELRGISNEMNCPIWTASQTNRSGLNAEVITMEAISEAFNKCFVADFIFTVSRTIEDKKANMGRIFVAKNRNGPDGLVLPIFMDTANVCIKILEDQDELEEQRANPVANAQEHIKNKYAHLLNK